jgi:hypothetical protein
MLTNNNVSHLFDINANAINSNCIFPYSQSNEIFGIVLHFLTELAVMAVALIASDLRGHIFHIAIVQGALP